MWSTVATAVLGGLGIVLNGLLAWPQAWRAAHDVAGIALGTVLTGFLGRVLWSAYAVHAADPALFAGQAPVAVGFAAIAFFVGRARRRMRLPLAAGMLAGLVVSVVLVVRTPPVLAAAAIVVAAAVNVPQMVRVLRDPASAGGVSAAMYWLTASASATWLTYGVVVHDLAISAPHVVLLPTAVLTAVAVRRAKTTAPDPGCR